LGTDGESRFTEGTIAVTPVGAGRERSAAEPVETATFEETRRVEPGEAPRAGASYDMNLSGTFETRGGERCTIRRGDVLLAPGTTSGGHRWRLVDDEPWRRWVDPTVRAVERWSDGCYSP
jgi:hypothetical protein